jgi:coenzyme F420-0:L-glutamate ligase/coenzyme F420-1:gamma-L-glutamate ligase
MRRGAGAQTEGMPSLTATALAGLPEVAQGVDLTSLIIDALQDNGIHLNEPMVVVLSSKIVSKALGLRSTDARDSVIDAQTVRVVAERATSDRITRIVEAAAGPVMAAAGVDASNVGSAGGVLVLPTNCDAEAASLRDNIIRGMTGIGEIPLGVIISDTAGRPWRAGQTDFALGSAGIWPMLDHQGDVDHDGRPLSVTSRCLVDQLAAMADLVKGKADGLPVAVIRGCPQGWFDPDAPGARTVVRTGSTDWFSLGHVEAVRASLGVAPGTPSARKVGIRRIDRESQEDRALRALAVARHGEVTRGVEVDVDLTRSEIRVRAADPFAAGRFIARLEVALWSEDLSFDPPVALQDGAWQLPLRTGHGSCP